LPDNTPSASLIGFSIVAAMVMLALGVQRSSGRIARHSLLHYRENARIIDGFDEFIGKSSALKRVLKQIEQVAKTDANVLILGETGTGKELVAHVIHQHSNRKSGPLIKINCAALPSTLIESELFGHEAGAFTGALTQKIGRFELASGGTIFLDEIGEMSPELQS
jgi:formate hydrogenlyase transcriptional activator